MKLREFLQNFPSVKTELFFLQLDSIVEAGLFWDIFGHLRINNRKYSTERQVI